jgi:hypothetical protein
MGRARCAVGLLDEQLSRGGAAAMAFREQEYKERCGICGEEADERCPRCRQNTCKAHRTEDLVCQVCEQDYVDHERGALEESLIDLKARKTVDLIFGVVYIAMFGLPPVLAKWFSWVHYLIGAGIVLCAWFFLVRRRSQERLKARLLARERKRLRARFISSRSFE